MSYLALTFYFSMKNTTMDDLKDLIEKYTDVDWNRVFMPEMKTEELMELLADLGLYANTSIALEIAKRSDALFWLRKKLQDGAYWHEGEGWAPLHALHILPLIGSSEALDLLLDIIRYKNWDLGDLLIEDMPAILYGFGDGEEGIDAIKDFAADETLETFSRVVAVSALTAFAKKGKRYEEIKNYLLKLLESSNDSAFTSLVVDYLSYLKDSSVLPAIHRAFERGAVEDDFVTEEDVSKTIKGDYDDLIEGEMERDTREPLDFFSRREVERNMAIYKHDEPKEKDKEKKKKKIGRNDPCPCGSGKKFKKCCMGKGIYD